MAREIWPWFYTRVEGGDWLIWPGGPISQRFLRKRSGSTVECKVAGLAEPVAVHSMAFETPMSGQGNFGRWDCVNGWTCTIKQAASRWPHGRHGKSNAHLHRRP